MTVSLVIFDDRPDWSRGLRPGIQSRGVPLPPPLAVYPHSTAARLPVSWKQAVENPEIGGGHRDGEQPASLERVSRWARRVEGDSRQGKDEPRPAVGMLRAFEPTAGDGGLDHPGHPVADG